MNIIADVNRCIDITDERRKEIFDIFKKIVLDTDTLSGIIEEVQEYPGLCDSEKSYLMYAFVLAGRASIVKMANMDATTYKGLVAYLDETIRLEE